MKSSRSLLQLTGQAENRFYGHLNILAQYCGLDGEPWLNGYLQHGWNGSDGWGYNIGYRRAGHKFVWSARVAEELKKNGGRNFSVVGSPWLYLLKTKKINLENAVQETGVIAYPVHSQPWGPVEDTHENYSNFLAENYGSVTVCLHWTDFEKSKKKYQLKGHTVITYGIGTPWLPGYDKDILTKQLETLLHHSIFVSNAFQTSALYALSLGLKVEIGGPKKWWVKESDYKEVYGDRGSEYWNQLVMDQTQSKELWRSELGFNYLMSSEQLKSTLDWNSNKSVKKFIFFSKRLKDVLLDGNLLQKLSFFTKGRV